MTFTVEVLLKGEGTVVDEVVRHEGPAPKDWSDDDVRHVLELTLLSFDRVQNPEAEAHTVSLCGLSWIVTPVDRGVAIAIEIPSGAVVAGPFGTDAEALTASISRVLSSPLGGNSMVH